MQIPNLCVWLKGLRSMLMTLAHKYCCSLCCWLSWILVNVGGGQLIQQVHDEGVNPIAELVKSTLLCKDSDLLLAAFPAFAQIMLVV